MAQGEWPELRADGVELRVKDGDTLQSVAETLWGDSSLWYMIASANGLQAGQTLTVGTVLKIPNKIHNIHNDTDSFRVYDPNEAIGDTSPTAPKPNKGNKCGVLGQVLLVAVAVAVAALLPGATPVVQAIAGSVASQAVGLATGIQQKFSFKSLALAAITAGVGSKIGISNLPGGKLVNDIATGVARSAVTQGIGIATGLQSKFSWAGLAAAGIGNGVTQAIAGRIGFDATAKTNIANSFKGGVAGMAGGIAGAAAKSRPAKLRKIDGGRGV